MIVIKDFLQMSCTSLSRELAVVFTMGILLADVFYAKFWDLSYFHHFLVLEREEKILKRIFTLILRVSNSLLVLIIYHDYCYATPS